MDRKNTLLLTVIAIATLLVAVVGATFAFFSAQNFGNGKTDVNVKTETTTSIVFDQSNNIDILANMSNFTQDDIQDTDINTQPSDDPVQNPHTMGKTTPSETLTGASTLQDANKDKVCYSATLKVYKNTFTYDPTDEKEFNQKKAELLLVVKKTPQSKEEKAYTNTDIEDSPDTYKYVADVSSYFDTHSFNTTYADLKGFDITTLGSAADCLDENGGFKEDTCATTDFKIPVFSDDDNFSDPTKKYIHVLEAGKDQKASDKWEVAVYFLNHDKEQNYNSAGKRFAAKFVLQTVDCTTGLATKGE